MYTSIFGYFIDSVTPEGEAMKSSQAYQYFHSNEVGCLMFTLRRWYLNQT